MTRTGSKTRCLVAAAACWLTAAAPPATMRVASVTDGDTFRLASGERIRIAGIDAPETHPGRTRCAAELARGRAATRQVRALLAGRQVGIVRVGRSYARTVARVTLDGRDLASELVAIGAARWWPRGAAKPDWCEGERREPRPPRRRR